MSQIIKNGNVYSLANVDQVKSTLPLGTYNLVYIPMQGFKLIQVSDFILPPKIYGDTSLIDRSIAVYKSRERNFGLLLSGLRGSGKSLLMKKLALQLHQPIIILNQSFAEQSDELIEFLTDPTLGDCTILFDEFEKRFSRDDVTPLTLLDGPYNTHHFFILTVNELYVNENLLNRPGRIYYRKQYVGLDDEMVREVGEDLLANKEFVDELVSTCEDIRELSFDMLMSLIHDINLFNEPPKECIKHFGFDDHVRGQFINIHQILPSGEIVEVLSDGWITQSDRYYWTDDCIYFLNDGHKRTIDLRLDLSTMIKLSKNKYKLLYQLEKNRVDEEERDNFTDQTLTFEINLNSNKTAKLLF